MTGAFQGPPPRSDAIQFYRDMPCCKPWRAWAGMSCPRPRQMACAWHHLEALSERRSPKVLQLLQAFAEQLLSVCAWPVDQVFWSFRVAGEMSALALVCSARWGSMPEEDRAAYRGLLVAATTPEFMATFDVLCEGRARNGARASAGAGGT